MLRYAIETTNLASGPESLGLSYHGPPTAGVSGSGIDGGGVRERDRACETNTLKNLTAPCKPALPRAGVDVRRWRPQPATCSDCRCGCIMIIFQSTIAQHCRAVGLPTLGPLKLAARTVCALTTCLQPRNLRGHPQAAAMQPATCNAAPSPTGAQYKCQAPRRRRNRQRKLRTSSTT